MLILTRSKNESIVITTTDGPLEIEVLDVRGDKIRLGITGPRNIPVHRKEIQQRIDKEKKDGTIANLPG